MLCSNCREEGHKASQCTRPVQVQVPPRYVPTLPREQTAMNWKSNTAVLNPIEEPPANVRLIQEYEDVRRVSTRRRIYDRSESRVFHPKPYQKVMKKTSRSYNSQNR